MPAPAGTDAEAPPDQRENLLEVVARPRRVTATAAVVPVAVEAQAALRHDDDRRQPLQRSANVALGRVGPGGVAAARAVQEVEQRIGLAGVVAVREEHVGPQSRRDRPGGGEQGAADVDEPGAAGCIDGDQARGAGRRGEGEAESERGERREAAGARHGGDPTRTAPQPRPLARRPRPWRRALWRPHPRAWRPRPPPTPASAVQPRLFGLDPHLRHAGDEPESRARRARARPAPRAARARPRWRAARRAAATR